MSTTPQRSLLEPTGNEAAERDAIADVELPGVWAGEDGADLRALTQEQTDRLIRGELIAMARPSERDEVIGACSGPPAQVWLRLSYDDSRLRARPRRYCAAAQRGGIDSDPLVRLLAFRAWGDRDRRWFELRGVRTGDAITYLRGPNGFVIARAWDTGEEVGHALADARPDELVAVRIDAGRLASLVPGGSTPVRGSLVDIQCRVGDRLREPPDHPRSRAPILRL